MDLIPTKNATEPESARALARHELLIEDWLVALHAQAAAGQLSALTVTAYGRWIRPWQAYLKQVEPGQPTPATVERFIISHRIDRSPASANGVLHAIKSCYSWAETQDRYPAIARSVRALRIDLSGPLPILDIHQVAEVARLARHPERRTLSPELSQLGSLRNEALIRCLYAAGVRLVSMVRADVVDCRLEESPPALVHQPKGHRGKDARAHLPPLAADSLRAYLAKRQSLGVDSPALWIGIHPKLGSRMDTKSLRRIIVAGFERAGLVQRGADGHIVNPRIISAQCLRRSATTQVVEHVGIEAGQVFAGHASIDTTRKSYARVNAHRILREASQHLDLPP